MALMIKWRFRDTRSLSKNVMISYANYVERQVLERVEKTSEFMEYDSLFTSTMSEDKFIERLLSSSNRIDEPLAHVEKADEDDTYGARTQSNISPYNTNSPQEFSSTSPSPSNHLSGDSSPASPVSETYQNSIEASLNSVELVLEKSELDNDFIIEQSIDSPSSSPKISLISSKNEEDLVGGKQQNLFIDDPHLDLLYQRYTDDLKTAPTLFSAPRSDISELKKSLYQHQGNVWIPIISLKESEAISLGLTSEDEWKSKARDIIPGIANALKIPESNLNYLVGFHEKPEARQNKEADAGSQPHLHFIIWEKHPHTQKAKISSEELKNLRKNITDVFTSGYSYTLISNQLEDAQSVRNTEKNFRKISDACSSTALILKQYVDHFPTLEDLDYHSREVSRIIDRNDLGESLTSTQSALIANHNLKSQTQLVNRLRDCYEVKDRLGEIAEEVLNHTSLDAKIYHLLLNNPELKRTLESKLEYKSSSYDPNPKSYSYLKINERIKQITESIDGKSEKEPYIKQDRIRGTIKEILESNLYKSLCLADVSENSYAICQVGLVNMIDNSAPNPLATEEQLLFAWSTVAQFAASKNIPMMELIDAAWNCNRKQNLNINPFDIYADIEAAYERQMEEQTVTSPKTLDDALTLLGYNAKGIESEMDEKEMWKRLGWSAEETLRMFIPSEYRKRDYTLIQSQEEISDVINEYIKGVRDDYDAHAEEEYVRKK